MINQKPTRQDVVDVYTWPERVVVVYDYNRNVDKIKDNLTKGFRKYLDTLPSQFYLTADDFNLTVPFSLVDMKKFPGLQ